MRVVSLVAQNFKRLQAVEIVPTGNVVTIGGKNGHGKSSVLDAIYVALKGRAANAPVPIHAGAEKCLIRLDMGDLVITRTFTRKGDTEYTDTLKVENAEGFRASNPQATLNALLGEIGFDPFEFAQKDPKKQAATILEMVPLSVDLDELAEQDKSDYANRRDINRDGTALAAQLDAIPVEEVPENAPDRDALTERLASASETNIAIERERTRRVQLTATVNRQRQTAASDRERAAELRAEATRLNEAAAQKAADAAKMDKEADTAAQAIAELPELDTPVDAAAIQLELRQADATLALIDRQKRRAELATRVDAMRAKSEGFTKNLQDRAKLRTDALAKARMPVEGLGIGIDAKGEAYLTWEGLPFDKDQISTAIQLRVSTAIGMAANPQLRVLRIKDGSLLDEDSMAMLSQMAVDEDFQLWVEVVGNGGTGIIMENGAVRGDEPADDDPKGPTSDDAAPDAPAAPKARKGKASAKAQGGLL
jgi:hypothetical protein